MHCLEASTQLLAHGLSSRAARDFLEQLPQVEELMPPLEMA
jgi:hypothetical protein